MTTSEEMLIRDLYVYEIPQSTLEVTRDIETLSTRDGHEIEHCLTPSFSHEGPDDCTTVCTVRDLGPSAVSLH